MFYVYQHRRKDNNSLFYVGKGHGSRCTYRVGRNAEWNRIVDSAGGFVSEILIGGLTEEGALLLEMERIDQCRRLGLTLANKTHGGEGVCGLVHTDETRRRMSAAKVGKTSPRKGAILSCETRQKISAIQKGVRKKTRTPEHQEKINAANRGSRRSEESKLKMSLAKRGKTKPPMPESTKAKLRALALQRHAARLAFSSAEPE